MCALATQILAMTSIQKWQLFHSAYPEMRQVVTNESGIWSSEYVMRGVLLFQEACKSAESLKHWEW